MQRTRHSKSRHSKVDVAAMRSWFWSLLPIFGLVSLIIFASWMWLLMTSPTQLAFKHIKVQGSYIYLQPEELKQTIQSSINGGFFSIDLKRLKQKLLMLPWIENVAVRREWPSTLVITIVEQHPVARWNNNAVVNDHGQLFYPPVTSVPPELPQLIGPDDTASTMLSEYNALNLMLKPLNLSITEMRLSPRHAWHLALSNNTQITLGRQEVEMRFAKFVSLYPHLQTLHSGAIENVDLRYPNGFAVSWSAQ